MYDSGGWGGGALYGCDGLVEDCVIVGNRTWVYGAIFECEAVFSSCVITGNSVAGAVFVGRIMYDEKQPREVVNCTIADNVYSLDGGDSAIPAFWACETTAISDCIMWNNDHSPETGQCCESSTPSYCCIQDWTGGGEGNISDDPHFASGPDRDYYLSSTGAGQDVDSPCIDAGSDTASSMGMSEMTTHTDGEADTGIVDIGFHYSTEPVPAPDVKTYLNKLEFSGDDVLIGYLEFQNAGLPALVDIYVGFILPSGSILYYDSNDMLSTVSEPWRSDILLPADLSWGPGEVLRMAVPEGTAPGSYIFGAGLPPVGQASFISGHSTAFDIR